MKKERKTKTNLFCILSSVVAGLIIISSGINGSYLFMCIFYLIMALSASILGIVGRSQVKKSGEKGKGLGLVGIIVGAFFIFMIVVNLVLYLNANNVKINDSALCFDEQLVKDCKDNEDGTSTCIIAESYEGLCSTDILKESQFKK